MHCHTRRRVAGLALTLVAYASSGLAQTTGYPNRPIKIVVPYPTGGGTDITARALANRLSEILSQSVVVENKPGATGTIGADSVVKSKPDGYTVLMGAASEMALNASLFKSMAYNPRTDLEPVSLVAAFPLVFVAPASGRTLMNGLIEDARRQPGTITYGSIGQGSPQHLAGEWLETLAKIKLVHVPYKGSGPLVQDAVAAQIDLAVSSVPPAVPLLKAGRLRALAVTSSRRVDVLPDVPSMTELGYVGYEFNTWVAAAVPAGTPASIIGRLNDAILKALAMPDVQAVLREQGAEPVGSTPQQLRAFILQEIAKSDQIVIRAWITLE